MNKQFLFLILMIIDNALIRAMEITQSQPKRSVSSLKTIAEKYLLDDTNNHPCDRIDKFLTEPLCDDIQNDLKKQFLTKYALYGVHKGYNSTKIHDYRVEKSVVSTNGESVYFLSNACNANNKGIVEIDNKSNAIIGEIQGHISRISDFIKHKSDLTQCKEILISGSSNTTIKLWNPHNYKCLQTLYNEDGVTALASENTDIVCSLSADKVRIWDITSGKCFNKKNIDISGNNNCLLSNGILYTRGRYAKLIQLDLRTKTTITYGNIEVLCGFTCDSHLPVTLFAGSNNGVEEWDMRHPYKPIQIFYKNEPVNTLKVKNKLLYISLAAPHIGYKGQYPDGIKIWNLNNNEEIASLAGNGYTFNLETHDSGLYVSSTENLMKHSSNSYDNTYKALQNIDFTPAIENNPLYSKDIL